MATGSNWAVVWTLALAFAFGAELVPAWDGVGAGWTAGDCEFPILAGPAALADLLEADASKGLSAWALVHVTTQLGAVDAEVHT